MIFSSSMDLLAYLPAGGAPGPLTSDLLNPTSTASGIFGGHVLALRINIDFSDVGLTLGNLGVPCGDLQLRNFPVPSNLNDLTVRQMLGHANNLLGGGTSLFFTIPELYPVLDDLNASFAVGGVSQWAQDYLRVVPGFAADFDEDGDVDSADLGNWKGGFGTVGTATHLQGDADGDQDADGRDFLLWQRQFGRTPGSGAALAVVPSRPRRGWRSSACWGRACRCGRARGRNALRMNESYAKLRSSTIRGKSAWMALNSGSSAVIPGSPRCSASATNKAS